MGKSFRSADVNQALLLAPSLHDWLPERHLARFLVDVVDALDLGAIYESYEEKDGRGQAAYDPAMMVRVLLYGYCTGSYSSRKIQAKTYEEIAFRYLAADEHPDHSTLAEFRQRHLEALAELRQRAMVGMFVGRQVPKRDLFVGLRLDLARAVAPRAVAVQQHPPHHRRLIGGLPTPVLFLIGIVDCPKSQGIDHIHQKAC